MDWDKEIKLLIDRYEHNIKDDLYKNRSYGEIIILSAEYEIKIKDIQKKIFKIEDSLKKLNNIKYLLEIEKSLIDRKLYMKANEIKK